MTKKLSFYLNPIYWPAWGILGLFRLLTYLPYKAQLTCGRQLGRLLNRLPTRLCAVTQTNIRLCFPELSEAEQQRLIKRNLENVGMGIFETAMAWWLPDQNLESLVEIRGLEHSDAAFARGKGIILLSPHFTCLEIMGRLISMKYAFTALYRPHKKKFMAFLLENFRPRRQVTYIPTTRVRLLAKALEENQAIWYAYDVDGGKKRSVFAPFFGVQTASLTSISRLAALTGASIIPIGFYRRDDNSGYQLKIAPALDQVPSEDWVADAKHLNSALEKAIRQKPEQYLWQYKRFKTRPDGEERIY